MAVFNLIDHTEIGASGAVQYEKTSIPSSYDHLYFVASARTDDSGVHMDQCNIILNGVGGTSYGSATIYAGADPPIADETSSGSSIGWQYVPGASVQGDTFGVFECWIPNYANTSNYTQILTQYSVVGSSTTNYEWGSGQTAGVFMNTAAINQFTFYTGGGDDFVQYSTFTLYGINGAG